MATYRVKINSPSQVQHNGKLFGPGMVIPGLTPNNVVGLIDEIEEVLDQPLTEAFVDEEDEEDDEEDEEDDDNDDTDEDDADEDFEDFEGIDLADLHWITDLTVAEAKDKISAINDLETLKTVRLVESEGSNRKTLLAYIDFRIQEAEEVLS